MKKTEPEIVAEKTAYWQQEAAASRHLRHSGIRPTPSFEPIYHRIVSLIAPASRVLDVGCGHGRIAIPLAEAGHSVVAMDVSRAMLDILAANMGSLNIDIRQCDAHHLDAQDNEFDVVLSSDFMPHFPNWPILLKEQSRVCKQNGLILFAFNFTEHRTFAQIFGGDHFEHPYSPDCGSPKPFWAETTFENMVEVGNQLNLQLESVFPLKYLNDNYAFGGVLGTHGYPAFQSELTNRLQQNSAVANFYWWLEENLFQKLPFFAAYNSLVVFRKQSPERTKQFVASTVLPTASERISAPKGFLDQIPSETSATERAYLFDWFANEWDGQGVVLEIGPFLGGTTRAIAAGMLANPKRSCSSVLHTLDRFGAYYSPDRLLQSIQPLINAGILSHSQAETLCQSGEFKDLFQAIHSPHSYAKLIKLHNSALPITPDQISDSIDLFSFLNTETPLGAVFVDGCKSWTATYYTMREILPRLSVGAPVLFQDFGWYTCFWISSFVYTLRDYLEFETAVDSTYTYRLRQSVSIETIDQLFKPTPEEMGEAFFKKAATALYRSSKERQDLRGELIAKLHYVAALITLKKRPAAASILKSLDADRYSQFLNMIRGCIKSPTYHPNGKSILWTDD